MSEPHEGDERDRVLRQLYLMEPLGFVLIEADGNLNIEDFFERFHNCWHQYSSWFDIVDATPELTEPEKVALKTIFFGREVEDILSEDEMANRHERI